jgi:predicted anti-sigma-YlaC factor YlaD
VSADAANHLSEHRITRIVADHNAVHVSERSHLAQCETCRKALSALENDLERLRRQAVKATPAPERHFVLPPARSERHRISRHRWGWAAAGSVLSAALVTIVLWVGDTNRLPGISPTTLPVAAVEDPAMIKAQALAINALPPAYLALSESLDGGYDTGFIDFLIPPLDDDSMS